MENGEEVGNNRGILVAQERKTPGYGNYELSDFMQTLDVGGG